MTTTIVQSAKEIYSAHLLIGNIMKFQMGQCVQDATADYTRCGTVVGYNNGVYQILWNNNTRSDIHESYLTDLEGLS